MLLAAALGHEPELLVLDEPEAGVDFQGERLFWEVLDTARREYGFTQLMVSHNLPLAAHYATHVICLNKYGARRGSAAHHPDRRHLAESLRCAHPPLSGPVRRRGPGLPQCGALHGPDHLPSDPGQRLNVLAPLPCRGCALHVPPAATAAPDNPAEAGNTAGGNPHA